MAEHYLHSELEALKQEAAKLQQEYAAASAYIATLQVLQDVTRSLSSELNLEPLLQMILGSAVQVMRASAGSLLLLDRETDELVFEVDSDAVDKVRHKVVELMEHAADLDVALQVDAGVGSNWDEAH